MRKILVSVVLLLLFTLASCSSSIKELDNKEFASPASVRKLGNKELVSALNKLMENTDQVNKDRIQKQNTDICGTAYEKKSQAMEEKGKIIT